MSNTGWTCTWNPKNGTNIFNIFWINPVLITQKNIIYSSCLVLLWRNWVPNKISTIPIMFWCFYVAHHLCLECDNNGWKTWYFLAFFLFPVFIVGINDKTCLSYFDKPEAWSSSFSWTCMNLIFLLFQINPRFNSFSVADLSIHLSVSFIPSTTSLPSLGAPNFLSIIIENYNARRDSR